MTTTYAGITGPAVGNSTSALIGNRLTLITFHADGTVDVSLWSLTQRDPIAAGRGVSLADAVALAECHNWPVVDKKPQWMEAK